ncbi:MAG: hypothetical protein CMO44_02900, partial [Verrucomicrobiales bacterium]|nr:hypothetical protein [Verrucomicrobiales bacterium]
FGLDIDLGQAVGWEGTSFRLSGMDLHGSGIASRSGDIMGVSDIEGYGSVRLYESWLEKEFLEIGISLRAGLLLADEEFSTMDTAGPFLNATFGWPEFISMNVPNTGPAFYIPALGLRLLWSPSDKLYAQIGIFDGDTFDSLEGNDTINRHGLHWELGNGQGSIVMGEIGYRINQGFNDEGLPGTYKLGAWHHTGNFQSLYENSIHNGNKGIYASAEQMVFNEYSDQGLSFFARVGFAPEDRSELSNSFQIGLSYTGLIPNRDIDKFALGLSHAKISKNLPGRSAETVVEACYTYFMSDDFTIHPNIQWVHDPGASGELDDAVVFGLRVNLSI